MSKLLFTNKQVAILSKNKWIKEVSNKAITYTDEFKMKLLNETKNNKKFPRDVFKECGLDPNIVGGQRISNAANRWRTQYKNTGEISDTRKGNSGRKLKRELSDSEMLKRAEAKIKILEAENELLKKNEMIEMGILTDIKSILNLK